MEVYLNSRCVLDPVREEGTLSIMNGTDRREIHCRLSVSIFERIYVYLKVKTDNNYKPTWVKVQIGNEKGERLEIYLKTKELFAQCLGLNNFGMTQAIRKSATSWNRRDMLVVTKAIVESLRPKPPIFPPPANRPFVLPATTAPAQANGANQIAPLPLPQSEIQPPEPLIDTSVIDFLDDAIPTLTNQLAECELQENKRCLGTGDKGERKAAKIALRQSLVQYRMRYDLLYLNKKERLEKNKRTQEYVNLVRDCEAFLR